MDFHTYDVKSSLVNIRKRPRRLRQSEGIRKLVRESSLSVEDLVMPLFVCDGKNLRVAIPSLPGIYRLSMDLIVKECEELYQSGIPGVVLFGLIPEALKDKTARESYNSQGLYQKTIRLIKQNIPDLVLITDVAMDPYSSDGHDGIVDSVGRVVNDETLEILAKMALTQAEAGADIVAPSDMMDGRVGYIRDALDEQGFTDVAILSYSAKYASSFYGPFRDALGSTPKKGDKKTYQMDPANAREAVREIELDVAEGADMVMVKPGLPYLDVLKTICEISKVPVAVYNVSGEYAMVKAAAQNGWLNEKEAVLEILVSFKRAGANFILTYHAKDAAEWLRH